LPVCLDILDKMTAHPEAAIVESRGSSASATDWGLYIHIPFCEKKCPYCDFNTYAGLHSLFQATVDALCTEMEQWRTQLGKRPLRSIFLGGGTPTVLTASQLTQLFETVHRCFRLDAQCEITCEANPGTVDRPKFKVLHSLGVNRLSIGVQSFQPQELQFLGRIHDVADVVRAFGAAREAGFANINLDFIFGLPEQPLENWQATLEQALQLGPEHLSLYSLIVEPDTPLQHWVKSGAVPAPDDDCAATLYEFAMARLADAGYTHYEVSNWAKAVANPPLLASEQQDLMPALASQHNLLYWRNQEYVGIGPGAHSHLRTLTADGRRIGKRWGNRKPVAGYVKRINQGESVEEFCEMIEPRMAMGETMMLGLRLLQEGVTFERFQTLHQAALPTVFADELAKLHNWRLLDMDDQRVRLTRQGLMMGNQVFADFLPDLDK
jgi:oxygen-independent coproporphyrinogen-3 oxidase